MARIILTSLALSLAVPAAPALADQPGRDWISAARVTRIIASRGYKVYELKADDHHWEGKARRWGRNYEFHVNPYTGRVTRLKKD